MDHSMMLKRIIVMLLFIKYVDCARKEMTGFVIGGDYVKVSSYPHAVFLDIKSVDSCICGGSILNQVLVLTAAHCFEDYLGRSKDTVIIKYGASKIADMQQMRMLYYRVHDKYNERSMYADLAILRCKSALKFGATIKRVAIMEKPPLDEKMAYVSGWGSMNSQQDLPKSLKHTSQKMQSIKVCDKYLSYPAGTFCAGPIQGDGHPAVGDSGSALVVKQFIQIGIVSFKEEDSSLVVYTNVSYYYNWINKNAMSTYCA